MKFSNIYILGIVFLTISFSSEKLYAQLNPFGSSHFHNSYLNNPSFAGINTDLQIFTAIKQQFSSVPGAPKMQAITLDAGLDSKSGVGLSLVNDKAGLLRYTTLSLAYAYHLPLDNEDQKLNFGLSMSLSDYAIDLNRLKGDIGDIDVNAVNDRSKYLDGNFGIAYTSKTLNAEFAMPNIKQVLKKDLYNTADFALFYSAISYRTKTNFGVLEPKASYRGVHGYKKIIDAGLLVDFTPSEKGYGLNMFSMYHSTNSLTFGAGVSGPALRINVMYTTNTSNLQGYTNGDFEISLRLTPFSKRSKTNSF